MLNLGTETFRAPTAEDVDALIDQADLDGDGKINYSEFAKVMLEHTGSL